MNAGLDPDPRKNECVSLRTWIRTEKLKLTDFFLVSVYFVILLA